MNYEILKFWLDAGQVAATIGIGIYLYIEKRNDKTNQRLNEVEARHDARLDDHSSRIATLEGAMKQLPSHNDMVNIDGKVSQLARETSEQTGLLKGLATQVGLIQEWLYGRAK